MRLAMAMATDATRAKLRGAIGQSTINQRSRKFSDNWGRWQSGDAPSQAALREPAWPSLSALLH